MQVVCEMGRVGYRLGPFFAFFILRSFAGGLVDFTDVTVEVPVEARTRILALYLTLRTREDVNPPPQLHASQACKPAVATIY